MPIICPHDGHIIDYPSGDFCVDHGAKWFVRCSDCGAAWPVKMSGRYARTSMFHADRVDTQGSDFCGGCGMPGPGLDRPQLMEWYRNNVKASPEIPAAKRLELIEALTRLEAADTDNTKTANVWKMIRDAAPNLWEKSKPVRDVLIGEAVKRLLGL